MELTRSSDDQELPTAPSPQAFIPADCLRTPFVALVLLFTHRVSSLPIDLGAFWRVPETEAPYLNWSQRVSGSPSTAVKWRTLKRRKWLRKHRFVQAKSALPELVSTVWVKTGGRHFFFSSGGNVKPRALSILHFLQWWNCKSAITIRIRLDLHPRPGAQQVQGGGLLWRLDLPPRPGAQRV